MDTSTFLKDFEESNLENLLNTVMEGGGVRTSKKTCQVTLNAQLRPDTVSYGKSLPTLSGVPSSRPQDSRSIETRVG